MLHVPPFLRGVRGDLDFDTNKRDGRFNVKLTPMGTAVSLFWVILIPMLLQLIVVGTRHCRVLILGNINSDATGFDIIGDPIIADRNLNVAYNGSLHC